MNKELSDKKIEAGWHQTFSTGNPFCPCDLKSFTKAVKWTERALNGGTSKQPTEDSEMSLIESQIEGLLEGDGALEDHADVMTWLAASGLRESMVRRVHRAISCFERDHLNNGTGLPACNHIWSSYDDEGNRLPVGYRCTLCDRIKRL